MFPFCRGEHGGRQQNPLQCLMTQWALPHLHQAPGKGSSP